MRKIMESPEDLTCPCGNPIFMGELMESRIGHHTRPFRCLGCFVRSPNRWTDPGTKGPPYSEALTLAASKDLIDFKDPEFSQHFPGS